MSKKLILGIETSCDDTSVCLLEHDKAGPWPRSKILFHESFSAEKLLAKWGGIVPEIAARNHLYKLSPLLERAFEVTKLTPKDLHLIGVTSLPGLLGPLLTGLHAAKTLAMLYELPMVGVNHLFAHLEAIHLTEEVSYPYLGLLVSGGHSMFFLVKSPTDFEVLGTTIDDAAGEAFDKGGKLMGLSYPAGREIDDLAKKGDIKRFPFPIGLEGDKRPCFSFSGLKTSLRLFLENHPHIRPGQGAEHSQDFLDLCASYQEAIVSALSKKTKLAYKVLGKKMPLVLGGGVAANSALRKRLGEEFSSVHFVRPMFCTDNGAMVAHYAALVQDEALPFPECLKLDASARYINKKDFLTP